MAARPPSGPPNTARQKKRDEQRKKPYKPRKVFTYEKRREICRLIDEGWPKRRVASKMGVNESTIRGIYAKKDHILSHFDISDSPQAATAQRSGNQLLLHTEQLLHRYVELQKGGEFAHSL